MGFRECHRIVCRQLEENRLETLRCRRNRTTMQAVQQGHSVAGQIDSLMAAIRLHRKSVEKLGHLAASHQ